MATFGSGTGGSDGNGNSVTVVVVVVVSGNTRIGAADVDAVAEAVIVLLSGCCISISPVS